MTTSPRQANQENDSSTKAAEGVNERRPKSPTQENAIKINFIMNQSQSRPILLEITESQKNERIEQDGPENGSWELVDKETIPPEPEIEKKTDFHLEKTKFYPHLEAYPRMFQPNFASENFGLTDVGELLVQCTTWNMQGNAPPTVEEFKNKFLFGTPHILAVGTQECERSIQMSFLNTSKSKWEKTIYDALNGNISNMNQTTTSEGLINILQQNEDYIQLTSVTLLATHLAIFLRRELAQHVKEIKSFSVATGFLNEFGNKGGVAVSFELFGTSFVFINCHLTAHQEKIAERNDNYLRIVDELSKRPEFADFLFKADRIFFMGDMNYRINGNFRVIEHLVDVCEKNPDMWDVLWGNDQLEAEKKKKSIFQGFSEGKLFFKPTYKMDGTSYYKAPETKKKSERIPSWTDRVLFKSNKDPVKQGIVLLEYDSLREVTSSDHTPVMARFLVYVPKAIPHIKKIQNAKKNWAKVKQASTTPSQPDQTDPFNSTIRSLSAPQSSICQLQ